MCVPFVLFTPVAQGYSIIINSTDAPNGTPSASQARIDRVGAFFDGTLEPYIEPPESGSQRTERLGKVPGCGALREGAWLRSA